MLKENETLVGLSLWKNALVGQSMKVCCVFGPARVRNTVDWQRGWGPTDTTP